MQEFQGSQPGRKTTWGQLIEDVSGFQRRLSDEPDEAVMIASKNRVEVLAALLGALGMGRQVLLASPHSTRSELTQLIETASISAVLGDTEACQTVMGLGVRTYAIDSLTPGGGGEELIDVGTGAVLLQSSGTTGPPKIVVRERFALDSVGTQVTRALGLQAGNRMLVMIPLYHSYGLDMAVLAGLTSGCQLDLHEAFKPAAATTALQSGGLDLWPAVPVMLDAVSRGTDPSERPGSGCVFSAGSPLPLAVARRFEKRFGLRLGQIYGTSEFGSVTYNDPEDADYDPCCAGSPMEGVKIRVIGSDGSPLGPREEGEVVVSGPSVMSGYLDGTKPIIRLEDDSYVQTGDTGLMDAMGRLYLTGRTKLFIDVGGQKVNPIEVESVLARFPGVREVVVVSTLYTATADRVKAILLPEEGSTVEIASLREFAKRHLSPFKVPRRFEIRKELPRSPTGKVLRSELQAAELDEGRTRARLPSEDAKSGT